MNDEQIKKSIKKNVLLVEDDKNITAMVKAMIEDLPGYRFYAVDTVALAKEIIEGIQFDILIADYNLPGQTSEEAVKMYSKQIHESKKLIVHSGNPDAEKMSQKYGGIFLKKPDDSVKIITVIEEKTA